MKPIAYNIYLTIMRIKLTFVLFALIVTAYQKSSNFGLLTVTHSRNGDFSVLQKYLKLYAQTSCYTEFITEINLVWNNQVPPQSTPIFNNKQNWKIPVYFYRTTFNSMDHRYRLPKDSTAQLLYSLDDDIIVDCNTFKITLNQYNKVSNGRLGRIVTNQVRGFKFQPSLLENAQFFYQGHASAQFFTISQPGAAFIPRHYLQVYYLRINELIQLRNEILDVKNCDDIFFYAFAQYFYPELPAVYVSAQKDYKNTDPKIGQSKVKNVYQTRSKCISHISQFMGYNPLRFFSKNSSQFLSNWKYDNLQMILELKIRGFSQVQSQKPFQKGTQQNAQNKETNEPDQAANTQKQVSNQHEISKEQPKLQASQEDKLQKSKLSNQLSKSTENTDKNPISTTQMSNQADKQTTQEIKTEKQQEKDSLFKLNFEQQAALQIFLLLVMFFVCFQLYKKNCDKKMQYRIRIEEEQSQSISIKLPERY